MYKSTFLALSLLFSTSINNCIAGGLFEDEHTPFTFPVLRQWKSDDKRVKNLLEYIEECEGDLKGQLHDEYSFSLNALGLTPEILDGSLLHIEPETKKEEIAKHIHEGLYFSINKKLPADTPKDTVRDQKIEDLVRLLDIKNHPELPTCKHAKIWRKQKGKEVISLAKKLQVTVQEKDQQFENALTTEKQKSQQLDSEKRTFEQELSKLKAQTQIQDLQKKSEISTLVAQTADKFA